MRDEMDRESTPLAARIADYKSDPEKLQQVTRFVDDLLEEALKKAEEKRRQAEYAEIGKRTSQESGGLSGVKRRTERLGTRARGFAQRMFDILCNCSQQAAEAARTHTQSFRVGKR